MSFMQLIEYILKGIEYSLFGYFTMSSLYIFVFAFAGHFYEKRRTSKSKVHDKIAVLIPAYKEDTVIVDVAKMALKQKYPTEYFDVVIIADSLKKQTIVALKELPVILIEVSFTRSTKSKALNFALDNLSNPYDVALVLDADNIMEPEFLVKINDAFQKGNQIVQGHRKAKNLNTSFAILDAASEEINNHIFRKGHRVLGLSSGLIGSGMAFNYNLFKSMMASVKAIGGFDKELEFKLAMNKIEIEYLQDAIVLDEKIQKSSDFSIQRRRWLSTQFVYLQKYFGSGCKEFFLKGNINFFDKLWQMLIPPRILLIGLTFFISLIYFALPFIFNMEYPSLTNFWYFNLLITVIAFVLALPRSFYNLQTIKALISLPSAFIRMALLLFKLKGANKKFIHTVHGTIKN
ncbi:glycosyltransferase family 2 protein [Hyunsoonleella aestuarii]|uniref:Glycosyltransferase family 2 protein n=2 Tax=Hyunsoonleella aestuarii TaxID=912802 RepID=A0ABP8ECY2_9FLAO